MPKPVIPAQAGISNLGYSQNPEILAPACAGVTFLRQYDGELGKLESDESLTLILLNFLPVSLFHPIKKVAQHLIQTLAVVLMIRAAE